MVMPGAAGQDRMGGRRYAGPRCQNGCPIRARRGTLTGFALSAIDLNPGWRPDDSGLTPGYSLQRLQRWSGA